MPGGKHDVYVFNDDSGYKVRPAVAAVIRTNKISIRNCTDVRVAVNFQGAPITAVTSPIIPPGRFAKFKIESTADGVYPYQVLVTAAPGFTLAAVGESGPKIIVDP